MRDDGGAAFPESKLEGQSGDYWTSHTPGMSLRDYFAAKALQGILADPEVGQAEYHETFKEFAEEIATESYAIAEAMLEARK